MKLNDELVALVAELKQRDHEMSRLNRMNDLLQACATQEEAYEVIALMAGELFAGHSGFLAMLQPWDQRLETVARWGDEAAIVPAFALSDCWAMRRGQPHEVVDPHGGLVCRHFVGQPATGYLCVPLTVQGETLGLLCLIGSASDAPLGAVKQQLAVTMGEAIKLSLSNLRLREKLREQATRDALTGLYNRRYLDETLARELHAALRRKSPLCVAMLDLDHFKRFNDTFGHEAGDDVLRELGQRAAGEACARATSRAATAARSSCSCSRIRPWRTRCSAWSRSARWSGSSNFRHGDQPVGQDHGVGGRRAGARGRLHAERAAPRRRRGAVRRQAGRPGPRRRASAQGVTGIMKTEPLNKKRTDAWSWKRRTLAGFAGALLLAFGLFALQFVTANVLLRTRLLRAIINDGPNTTSIEYRSAYSLWPGRVRISGLLIRDRSAASEWMIALDECRASIGLFDLIRGQFHPTRIRGKGLTLRVRSRLTPEEATPRYLSFLPSIPGFPDPPLREPGQTAPLPTGRGWTVRLDDVAVDGVREIWVDEYHYVGDATMTGSMLLHPRLRLEVFPSSLEVRSGTLRFRDETLAASVVARLEAVVHPCDLREASGDAVLRFLTGKGRATGRIEGVRFLNEVLETPPTLRLEGGTGTLAAELSLDRGHGKGVLDVSASGVEAVMTDAVLTGEAEGQLLLASLDLEKGFADFSGSRLEVRNVLVKRGSEEPWLWWGRLDLVEGDLRTGPPRILYAHVTAHAQDARPLYRLLNAQLPPWAERLLTMEGVTATAHVALARSFLDVKSLEAEGGAFRILGRYHAEGELSDGAFVVDAGPLALGVALRAGRTELKLVGVWAWFREHGSRDDKTTVALEGASGSSKSMADDGPS